MSCSNRIDRRFDASIRQTDLLADTSSSHTPLTKNRLRHHQLIQYLWPERVVTIAARFTVDFRTGATAGLTSSAFANNTGGRATRGTRSPNRYTALIRLPERSENQFALVHGGLDLDRLLAVFALGQMELDEVGRTSRLKAATSVSDQRCRSRR